MFSKSRTAITSIEWLVVLAIIAILVALLLPAVDVARKANLKNEFGQAFGELPSDNIQDQELGAAERARIQPFIDERLRAIVEHYVLVLMERENLRANRNVSTEQFLTENVGLTIRMDHPEKEFNRLVELATRFGFDQNVSLLDHPKVRSTKGLTDPSEEKNEP